VATQTLTPVVLNPATTATTANITNLTSGVTAITGGNTVQFPNITGQTLLYIAVGGTGGTIQLNVGSTIFGQTFAPFSVITLTLSTNYILGLIHSALDIPGSINVTVLTSGALVSSMAALQMVGVY
jgi:hypothetical protein